MTEGPTVASVSHQRRGCTGFGRGGASLTVLVLALAVVAMHAGRAGHDAMPSLTAPARDATAPGLVIAPVDHAMDAEGLDPMADALAMCVAILTVGASLLIAVSVVWRSAANRGHHQPKVAEATFPCRVRAGPVPAPSALSLRC